MKLVIEPFCSVQLFSWFAAVWSTPEILQKGQNRRQTVTYFYTPAAPGQKSNNLGHLQHFTTFYTTKVRVPVFGFDFGLDNEL